MIPNQVASDLIAKIQTAFAHRKMPSEVIQMEGRFQIDSDVEDTLWFQGRDWREVTCDDWRQRYCAVHFLSPEAFAYYLPSLLILTLENPGTPTLAFESIIYDLDRSPSTDGWPPRRADRFFGLRPEEYDVLKEWLLFACQNVPFFRWGDAASGPGEMFGRAFDTVDLLQKETALQKMIDEEDSGVDRNV